MFKKIWVWIDDRTGITEAGSPFLNHLVPPDARWLYVFGSATLFCFILQVITGLALALIYQPSTGAAYDSLKYITYQAPFGHFLRGLHYFGASTMIFLVGIHMIRVFLMAAFKYPREMSWITGSILLVLTVTMGFTGQLLRWDSDGVWSAIVGAEQAGRIPFVGKPVAKLLLGGDTITGLTVSRFFSIHVFLLPGLIISLIALHIYLVIKNGISEPPKSGQKVDPENYRSGYHEMLRHKGVPFWPDAGWRDLAFGIAVILLIIFLAYVVGPPELGKPPDPTDIDANPRPDWYFLWIFALFALMPREIETFAIAFSPVLLGAVLILMPIINNKGERNPLRRPWSIAIILIIVTMVGTLWYVGKKSPWSPAFQTKPLSSTVIGDVSAEAKTGGELFYKKACIYCHNISGFGGSRGPSLTDAGSRLTKDQLTIKIVNGGGNMPAFGGTLKGKDLNDLVTFLMTRKEK